MPSASPDLPDALPIDPRGPLDASVRVPGSKSITNRALLIAALAQGESQLSGALASVDTEVMRESLMALGAGIESRSEPWYISGTGGTLRQPRRTLHVENSGTSARLPDRSRHPGAGPGGDRRQRPHA